MIVPKQEFEETFKEIDLYFEFLKKIDEGYTALQNFSGNQFRLSTELSSILKANAYLLLYNVIEATIRNGIWEVFNALSNEAVHYKDLKKELKEILIDRKVNLEFRIKDETIVRQVHEIVEKAFQNSRDLYPPKRDLKISAGSLTIEKIKEALSKHGIDPVSISHQKQKEVFDETKDKRNDLAHGTITFKSCGSPLVYSELEGTKNYIQDYLQRVLVKIEDYILHQKYKAIP
jgi:rubrerythrin